MDVAVSCSGVALLAKNQNPLKTVILSSNNILKTPNNIDVYSKKSTLWSRQCHYWTIFFIIFNLAGAFFFLHPSLWIGEHYCSENLSLHLDMSDLFRQLPSWPFFFFQSWRTQRNPPCWCYWLSSSGTPPLPIHPKGPAEEPGHLRFNIILVESVKTSLI